MELFTHSLSLSVTDKERQKVSENKFLDISSLLSSLSFRFYIPVHTTAKRKKKCNIIFRCAFSEINVVMSEIKSLIFTYFLLLLLAVFFTLLLKRA